VPTPKSHPHFAEFLVAVGTEIDTLQLQETFELVRRPLNVQVLPLKWVFSYKLDADGCLSKFKARICVRGDLHRNTKADFWTWKKVVRHAALDEKGNDS